MTEQALLTPAGSYGEINGKKKKNCLVLTPLYVSMFLPCTRQETPPERGRGEAEYSNQLVQCFTDDRLSKN